ncbi:hypothetical protein B0H10DRAFT_2034201 [Mycena sp. CBHHK59/15]|nr:hypothetical protein B0H10DRAFT_2054574 [Mycena sp. CBHHK59/15]KAJ6617282.1 hypothetical protein B0H10DRAFT_2034201 [Mycena sp. CBHHK59/15]
MIRARLIPPWSARVIFVPPRPTDRVTRLGCVLARCSNRRLVTVPFFPLSSSYRIPPHLLSSLFTLPSYPILNLLALHRTHTDRIYTLTHTLTMLSYILALALAYLHPHTYL